MWHPAATSACFNPRPPRGGRPGWTFTPAPARSFNPRPPRGGRLGLTHGLVPPLIVSIHAPRAEGDLGVVAGDLQLLSFQSTPPARRATMPMCVQGTSCSRFNPRPPRGGRHRNPHRSDPARGVSIHAPRAEGDPREMDVVGAVLVSIHAPRAEGDSPSTPGGRSPPAGFNPRPPRGGRRVRSRRAAGAWKFQSTPPARRATDAER